MAAIKHILVVDDDGDVRSILVDILRDREYRVSSAVDGITMRQFLEGDDPVDAIVLDAAMPGEARATLALHAKDLGLPLVVAAPRGAVAHVGGGGPKGGGPAFHLGGGGAPHGAMPH